MLKKSKRKAGRVVRRTLADGTVKEYAYAAYKKAPNRVTRDSLEALMRAFMSSPRWASLKPRTQESYSTYLRPLTKIGHIPAKHITRRNILDIRDAIATTRGNGAATTFVRSASALFGWAVDQDWLSISPVYKIKALSQGTLPAWTVEQAEIALRGLPEHLRRVVILGLYTGQRRADLCAALWSAYDGREIRFVQQKTGAVVVLAVHPDLKAELDAWKIDATAITILTTSRGLPWRPKAMSCDLPEGLAKLGLPPGLNVHGLRKLFATELAAAGATTHEIASATGHKTLAMVQLYTASIDQRRMAKQGIAKLTTIYKRKPSL